MIVNKDQPSDREYDCEEEKVNHENVGNFMRNISAEKVFAFAEEEERELFDVSFIDDEHEYSIERVLSEVFRDTIIEELFKQKYQQDISQEDSWQFIEEEVKSVGEEAKAIGISGENKSISIIFLVVELPEQTVIGVVDRLTNIVLALLNYTFKQLSLFYFECVDIGQQYGRALG